MHITTLIPAYKPKYLIELLTCLRHQTVKPRRVIFSDDSPDRAFISMLTTDPLKSLVADLNIEVVQGPRMGGYNNFRHLLNIYRAQIERKTELFHFLLDDDVIFPHFYEQHLKAHQSADLKCVISKRWTSLESGQPIRDDSPVPDVVANSPHRAMVLTAPMLFTHTVGLSKNWLGEFSNATFKYDMAKELDDTSMDGISFAGLEDLGAFLKASLLGGVAYIQDHLGFFRQSAEQNSANPMGRPLKLAFLAYISLAIVARNQTFLSDEQSRQAIEKASLFILHHYQQEADMRDMCAALTRLLIDGEKAELDFLAAWKIFSHAPAQPLPA
jgi:hypothetical protein